MDYTNWKDSPMSWIQFHDKSTMQQWIDSSKELPDPSMIVAHTNWDKLRVYFVLIK